MFQKEFRFQNLRLSAMKYPKRTEVNIAKQPHLENAAQLTPISATKITVIITAALMPMYKLKSFTRR